MPADVHFAQLVDGGQGHVCSVARSGGRVGGALPVNSNSKTELTPDELLAIAINIFVKLEPNALGNAAYKLDPDGSFYNKATLHKKYYPRSGDIKVLEDHSAVIYNRARNVRRVVVVGPGPKEAFLRKEGQIIRELPNVEQIDTVDISEHFNLLACEGVASLAKELGRPLKHRGITMDFRAAAKLYDNEADPMETLVICTGGLITNTESRNHDTFPSEQFKTDLKALGRIAGPGGYVLATYDSNEDPQSAVGAYKTKDFFRLYLNVIEAISKHVPAFRGLDVKNFQVRSVWNPKAQSVDHKLVVTRPMQFVVPYKNGGSTSVTHRINLMPGHEFHIISSYKPAVENVSAAGNEVGMTTLVSTEEDSGPTIHMFQNTAVRSRNGNMPRVACAAK
ncbi:MAG: L-histidine N(alpha)-methyltransferase [Alphaproteobacteria bacterium]|nr:L-histidine N(alpha)-methyltransferase [Alphaproteobacteria bacterium]